MTCRDCGGRLLGTEVAGGRCGYCERALKSQVRPVVSQGSVTPDAVALPVGSSVTGSVTKQQKYRAKNPEKTKADSAIRVARWRAKQ